MTLPRLLLAVLVLLAVGIGAATVTGLVRATENQPELVRAHHPESLAAPRPEIRAAAALASWDAARAEAWAAGDVRRLGNLYTQGSVAGRRDRTMLRTWLARGLVVRGLTTQVVALTQVSRARGRWVLRVTDRVAAGTAVGRGLRLPLPRDAATTTIVTLRRVSGGWLVESVQL